MPAEQVQTFLALVMGFALAGALASGYQLVTRRPASFRLLQRGPRIRALAAIPFLAFAAPFVIMHATLRARSAEDRPFLRVMSATIVAGFWSLMTGTVVVMALQAALRLA